MILNPVIQGGGAEKVYKITDPHGYFPNTAKAGEFLITEGTPDAVTPSIMSANMDAIPHDAIKSGWLYRYSFVMPASDVTISY